MIDAHRRTLDQLATGVAIFGADQQADVLQRRLSLAVGSRRRLPRPRTDRLHGARPLARGAQAAGGTGLPAVEKCSCTRPTARSSRRSILWHLPDGRTMRVVTTPNPEGGVIYLFDDVTERLDLERRYDALIRVQGETLDNLAEAVAVFGSDGRLRLYNPAFARMWKLTPDEARRPAAYRGGHRLVPPAASATTRSGRACAPPSPRSTTASRSPAGSNAATATWSIARPCRCPTAPRW